MLSALALASVVASVATGCGLGGRTADPVGAPAPSTSAPLILTRTPAPPAVSDAVPRVGECRRDGSVAAKERRYDAQPPMPCDQPHGLETWKVATLPERWRTVRYLPIGDLAIDDELTRTVGQLCPRSELDAFLGMPARPDRWGTLHRAVAIDAVAFLPPPAQWLAGARWLRCDAGYRWAGDLTVSLAGDRGDPRPEAAMAACVDRDGWFVPCGRPHLEELVGSYRDITTAPPLRSAAPALSDQWLDRCREMVKGMLGLGERSSEGPPGMQFITRMSSADEWARGQGSVECYLGYRVVPGIDELRETAGSARATGARVPEVVR